MDSYNFKCTTCQKNFMYKRNLTRHVKSAHEQVAISNNYIASKFECDTCGRKFLRKDILIKHLRIHEKQKENYECNSCGTKFIKKTSVLLHMKTCGATTSETKYQCKICDPVLSFHGRCDVITHMKTVHSVQLSEHHLNFDSYEQFEEWKLQLEKNLYCQFSKYRVEKRRKGYVTTWFVCSRSGICRSKLKSEYRQRRLKVKGSKKIDGVCPAEMKVTKEKDSPTITVEYISTHLGHTLSTVSDLAHMSLKKLNKEDIARKIQMGTPHSHNQEGIAASHLSEEIVLKDILNAEALITSHSNWIKLYKKPGEENSEFPTLQRNDLAIIFMSPFQKSLLRKYGNGIIAMDGTYGMNPHGYILHALLIIDEYRETVASAFLLTNRNDKLVIDVFLQVIKKEIGVLNPQVLMSNMQEIYFNSWNTVFPQPKKQLFCTWHVREAWKKNLLKVPKESRHMLNAKLNDLENETDAAEFQKKLNLFVIDQNKDTAKFLEYFKNNYYNNSDHWSYSSRMFCGIYTNINVESFHKNLNYWYGCKKKVKQLVEGLNDVFKYLIELEKNSVEEIVCGKLETELKIIHQRHDHMIREISQIEAPAIMQVEENQLWLVSTFQNTNDQVVEMYTVQKLLKICSTKCPLLCGECNSCFHEYQCTCSDSFMKNNMCKHIHYLISVLNSNSSVELESANSDSENVNVLRPLQPDNSIHFYPSLEIEIESNAFDVISERKRLTERFEAIINDLRNADEVKEIENGLKSLKNRINALRS